MLFFLELIGEVYLKDKNLNLIYEDDYLQRKLSDLYQSVIISSTKLFVTNFLTLHIYFIVKLKVRTV